MALVAVLLCGFVTCARANALVSASVETDAFYTEYSTRLAVTVTNDGKTEMTDVRLSINGRKAAKLTASLAAGESISITDSVTVSEDILELGFFTVTVYSKIEGIENVEQCLCEVRRLSGKVDAELCFAAPEKTIEGNGSVLCGAFVLYNKGDTDIADAYFRVSPGDEVYGPFAVKTGGHEEVKVYGQASNFADYSCEVICQSAYSGEQYSFRCEGVNPETVTESIKLYAVCDGNVSVGGKARITVNIENGSDGVFYFSPRLTANGVNFFSGLPQAIAPGEFITVNAETEALYSDISIEPVLTALRNDSSALELSAGSFRVNVTAGDEIDAAVPFITAEVCEERIKVTLSAAEDTESLAVSCGEEIRTVPFIPGGESLEIYFTPAGNGHYTVSAAADGQVISETEISFRTGSDAEKHLYRDLLLAVIGARSLSVILVCLCAGACTAVLALLVARRAKKTKKTETE